MLSQDDLLYVSISFIENNTQIETFLALTSFIVNNRQTETLLAPTGAHYTRQVLFSIRQAIFENSGSRSHAHT